MPMGKLIFLLTCLAAKVGGLYVSKRKNNLERHAMQHRHSFPYGKAFYNHTSNFLAFMYHKKRLETSAFLGIETFEISYYTAKMHLCRTMRFQKTLKKIDCTIEERQENHCVTMLLDSSSQLALKCN